MLSKIWRLELTIAVVIRDNLFRHILVNLTETGVFSYPSTPSVFPVYAHDNAREEMLIPHLFNSSLIGWVFFDLEWFLTIARYLCSRIEQFSLFTTLISTRLFCFLKMVLHQMTEQS